MSTRMRLTPRTRLFHSFMFMTVAFATACTDSPGPLASEDAEAPQEGLTTTVSLPAVVEQAVTSGSIRIEVELLDDGPPWIAREIEVEGEDDRDDEEKIESRVVSADEASGSLSILFGDLTIDVSPSARFRIEGMGDVTREAFFERIATELAAGNQPGVESRRDPPASPQDPNDASFEASDLRLDDDADVGKLELNVAEGNFDVTGETTGVLTVLDVAILLDANQGTEFEAANDEGTGAVEIQGLAASVSEADQTVTLMDGRVIRLVEGTRIKDGGDEDRLRSLTEVAAALSAGEIVEVEAKAVLETEGVYIAIKIKFEVEGESDDLPGAREFEGRVDSVDLGAGTFSLADGLVLTITEATVFDDDGGPTSLQAVAEALDAGALVEAEGVAVEDVSVASGWTVIRVEFEVEDDDDDDDDDIEFEGRLASVDVGAGTFELDDGRIFTVTESTTFDADGDLTSLQEMADALDEDRTVEVEVEGHAIEDADTGALNVTDMKIETDDDDDDGEDEDDDTEEFEGRVESVDVGAGVFVLGGQEYTITESTTFDSEGDLMSLAAMAEALQDEKVIEAEGHATEDPDTGALLVTEIKVEIDD